MNRVFRFKYAVISIVLLQAPQFLLACERCFGAKADTPVTQGIGWAMFALLLITIAVLGTIVAFFIYMYKRAKMFEAGEIMVTEQGNIISHPGLLRDINHPHSLGKGA